MHDLIFWYTGGAVWAVVGLVLLAVVLIGVAWGIRHGAKSVAEWVSCYMLLRQFRNKADRSALYAMLNACGLPPGVDLEDFTAWLRSVYRHARLRYPELVRHAERDAATPWQLRCAEDPASLPPRKRHDYYGDRYSHAVRLRGREGLWCWDYNMRGWVDAHCSGGPDPSDYNVPIDTCWRKP